MSRHAGRYFFSSKSFLIPSVLPIASVLYCNLKYIYLKSRRWSDSVLGAAVPQLNYVIIIVCLYFDSLASGWKRCFQTFIILNHHLQQNNCPLKISRMDDGTFSASATTTTTYSVALLSSRRQVEISVRCFPFCLHISDPDSRIFHFALSNSNSLTTT